MRQHFILCEAGSEIPGKKAAVVENLIACQAIHCILLLRLVKISR